MRSPKLTSDGLAALGVLVLCFAMNAVARGAGETFAVFLLPIGEETGWHRVDLTSVYSIYMAASGLASPFVGIVFDRLGPRALRSEERRGGKGCVSTCRSRWSAYQ